MQDDNFMFSSQFTDYINQILFLEKLHSASLLHYNRLSSSDSLIINHFLIRFIMKKLDLTALGIEKLDKKQMAEINGGQLPTQALELGQMFAERNIGKKGISLVGAMGGILSGL